MSPFLGLHHNLILVFLTYGLAFFTMGIAVLLEWRSDSHLPLTRALPALATFAFLHGLMEWTHILLIDPAGKVIHGNDPQVEIPQLLLLSGSYFFLLWFGIDLATGPNPRRRHWHWATLLPFGLWVAGAAALAARGGLPEGEWVASANSLARYLLGFPGGIVAGWGLYRQIRVFRELKMPRTASDCSWAGVAFFLYALATGLVTPQAPLPPATFLNYGSFWAATGLPVQIFRTLLALAIAYFILRILRAYEEEQDRRLEKANRERYAAQQSLLEAHGKAEEQLQLWNETLEHEVSDRTSQLERRQQETEAIYRIGTEITAMLDLQTVLRSVVDKARDLLQADLAAVAVLREGQEGIEMRVTSGARTENFGRLVLEGGKGLTGMVVSTGEAVALDHYLGDPRIDHTPEVDAGVVAEGLDAFLAVPMKTDGRALGALLVSNRDSRPFGESDRWLLSRLALVAAIAIQNSRFHALARHAAVLEERERLSREIHDGVAQALGCLAMKSRAAQARLEKGLEERARLDLQEMERTAHEAYQDIREAILGLRVSSYSQPGLVHALRQYLERFGEQGELETRLAVSDGWPSNLPLAQEIQIIRIVQEALSNARKHAAGRGVQVELTTQDGFALISVVDDGKGFDPDEERRRESSHFGLRTMQERAEAIGGLLVVRSAPGKGTRIELQVHLEEEDEWNGCGATTIPGAAPTMTSGGEREP